MIHPGYLREHYRSKTALSLVEKNPLQLYLPFDRIAKKDRTSRLAAHSNLNDSTNLAALHVEVEQIHILTSCDGSLA